MPEISLPFELESNTTARASEVMANFNTIVNAINGGLESVNLADNSVGAGQIQANAVNTSELANGSVTTDKIAEGAVKSTQLADSAVTTSKLATDSVTVHKIADGAVITQALDNLAVTAAKLANHAVTADKIAPNTVSVQKLGDFAQFLPNDLVISLLQITANGEDGNPTRHPSSWSFSRENLPGSDGSDGGRFTVTHGGVMCNASALIIATPHNADGFQTPHPPLAVVHHKTSTSFQVDVIGPNTGFNAIIFGRDI